MTNNKTFPLPQPGILPTAAKAVAAYENDGGHLTCPEPYGVDLLANHPGLQQQRLMQLPSRFSSFDTTFYHLVNGQPRLFQEGLQYFIDLTISLNTFTYLSAMIVLIYFKVIRREGPSLKLHDK